MFWVHELQCNSATDMYADAEHELVRKSASCLQNLTTLELCKEVFFTFFQMLLRVTVFPTVDALPSKYKLLASWPIRKVQHVTSLRKL